MPYSGNMRQEDAPAPDRQPCEMCGGSGYTDGDGMEPAPDAPLDGAHVEPTPSFADALKRRQRGY